jgi:hypothetical protein
MLIELVAFVGLIIIAIVFIAEGGKHAPLGLVGATILLILGFWVMTDGIQYQISVSALANSTIIPIDNTTFMTVTTQTTTPIYEDIPEFPYLDIGTSVFIGLAFILLAIYGVIHYSFAIKED